MWPPGIFTQAFNHRRYFSNSMRLPEAKLQIPHWPIHIDKIKIIYASHSSVGRNSLQICKKKKEWRVSLFFCYKKCFEGRNSNSKYFELVIQKWTISVVWLKRWCYIRFIFWDILPKKIEGRFLLFEICLYLNLRDSLHIHYQKYSNSHYCSAWKWPTPIIFIIGSTRYSSLNISG